MGTETDILKFTKLIYPYYEESTKRSTINKFLNANNLNNDEIYNSVFDLIIDQIQRKLKQGKYSERDESHHPITSGHSSHTSNHVTTQKPSHKSNEKSDKKDSHTSSQKSSQKKSNKRSSYPKGKKTFKAELELLNQPEYLTQSTINYLAT